MSNRVRRLGVDLVALLLLAVFAGNVSAQSSPSAGSPAPDAQKLAERNRLSRECERLRAEGKLTEAIATAETMFKIERAILAEDTEDIRGSLIFLGEVAERAEDWKRAEAYRTDLVEWSIKHRGPAHWLTTDARRAQIDLRKYAALSAADRTELRRSRTLGNEMLQSYGQGKIQEAVAKAEQAREICGKTLGEKNQEYVICLSNLAFLYTSLRDDAKAESLHRRTVEILAEILGEKHPQFATMLNNLAGFYNQRRKYELAEPLYRRAVAVRKETLGEGHSDYATSLNDLATLYNHVHDYAKAEPLLNQAVDVFRDALGDQHPEYAKSLCNLATLYETIGDYARAEPLFLQGIAVYKETLGEKHAKYAAALNSLAVFYQHTGAYVRAEPLLRQVLALRKEILGEKHPDFAASLSNMAGLYREMQDYAQAELLYVAAVAIEEKTLDENDPHRATTLNNLAFVCDGLKDYARAESLYQQALVIRKATLGEKHPFYATTLNNLAEHYRSRGDYARAEPLIRQATDLTKETLGEKHPSYARRLNNLAGVHHVMGDDARAEPLYRQALAILKDTLGERHADYGTTLHNLAFFYAAAGRADEAAALYRQSLNITQQSLETAALIQSERQQLMMGKELRHRLDAYLSLGLSHPGDASQFFAEVLTWKGATLMRQRAMRLATDDPAVSELFTKLQRAARELAALNRAAPTQADQRAEWRHRVAALTQEKEALEAELSRQSADYRATVQAVTLDDLLAALPQDAVLIDYLEFKRSTPPQEKGNKTTFERQLIAFVVRHSDQPEQRVQLIALGPAAPVSKAIDEWRESYGLDPTAISAGNLLRKTLWKPILPLLAEAKIVLVSTDGALGRLPFVALPGNAPETYLLEDHRLAMIPVPQLLPALVRHTGRRELTKELLLLGDVDYDAVGPTAEPTPPKKKTPRRPGETQRSPGAFVQFSKLDYTKAEIDGVRELFGELFTVSADDPFPLTRNTATEAEFRKLAPQYRHLHLASHGFFAAPDYASADRDDAVDRSSNFFAAVSRDAQVIGFNPGLLSGLALAGANLEPRNDGDDGMLTALEIAYLPLNGVDLVVLSACETGLGAVAGGEGLLGVQRAFQVAGVGTTVAGLWKVDDLQTMALMKRFYHNLWKEDLPRLDALREAQLWMLREGARRDVRLRPSTAKPEKPQRAAPYHWAPFILSGDWR